MNSMTRLCIAIALCMAGLTAAQFTCPSSTVTQVYDVSNFTAAATCHSTLCSCLGGTGSLASNCVVTNKVNCSVAATCTLNFITCMNQASANNSALHMSLLAVASGELYNASVANAACRAFTCGIFNKSSSTVACAGSTGAWVVPYDTVCKSTATFRGTLRLAGNYTAILRNATAKSLLMEALRVDLSNFLGFPVVIIDIQEGSLVVIFEAPVSGSNAVLIARIAAAATSATWLTTTKTTFQTLGGDPNSITVIGIGATTPAPVPGPVTTPAPPTPAPARTSGAAAIAIQVLVALVAMVILA